MQKCFKTEWITQKLSRIAEDMPIRLDSVPIIGFVTDGKVVLSSKSGRGLTMGTSI